MLDLRVGRTKVRSGTTILAMSLLGCGPSVGTPQRGAEGSGGSIPGSTGGDTATGGATTTGGEATTGGESSTGEQLEPEELVYVRGTQDGRPQDLRIVDVVTADERILTTFGPTTSYATIREVTTDRLALFVESESGSPQMRFVALDSDTVTAVSLPADTPGSHVWLRPGADEVWVLGEHTLTRHGAEGIVDVVEAGGQPILLSAGGRVLASYIQEPDQYVITLLDLENEWPTQTLAEPFEPIAHCHIGLPWPYVDDEEGFVLWFRGHLPGVSWNTLDGSGETQTLSDPRVVLPGFYDSCRNELFAYTTEGFAEIGWTEGGLQIRDPAPVLYGLNGTPGWSPSGRRFVVQELTSTATRLAILDRDTDEVRAFEIASNGDQRMDVVENYAVLYSSEPELLPDIFRVDLERGDVELYTHVCRIGPPLSQLGRVARCEITDVSSGRDIVIEPGTELRIEGASPLDFEFIPLVEPSTCTRPVQYELTNVEHWRGCVSE
jgi:hypothetical protein